MRFLNTKIGRRLLGTFLAVSLLPLAIVSWLAITRAEATIKEEAHFELSAASSAAGGKLREFLLRLKQSTLSVSSDTRIVQALTHAKRRSGSVESPAELNQILKWYRERTFDAQEVCVLSDEGTVIASSKLETVGKDLSHEEYFQRGKKEFYPGDVTQEETGDVSWVMTAPILSEPGGKFLGVVACRVHPRVLSALTSGRRSVSQGARQQLFRIGETGETYIVNKKGLMITESRAITNAVLRVKVDTLPVIKGLQEDQEIIGDYEDYRGVNVSGTSVIFADMGWILITEIDFTQSFAPIRQLRNGLMVTIFVLGVMITIWASRWTKNLVTPIQNLQESDRAMAEGDQTLAIAPEKDLPDDEIGAFVRLRNERVKALFEKQRQLCAEQKRREEAWAELQEISYSIVHDMRAPLRAISGFAGILQSEAADRLESEHRALLGRMNRAACRMDQLISDMLSYSRMVRVELPLRTVSVSQLLSELITTYPSLQKARPHIYVAEDLPDVHGNEAALMQCLSCLLDNAVRFGKPNETPEIHIKSERSGAKVKIMIQDNGIGIPQHMQQRIFGIFQQGATSLTNTGIGLALVRKAAERMGGRVGVTSEPGKGSCFWIELEVARPSDKGTVGSVADDVRVQQQDSKPFGC